MLEQHIQDILNAGIGLFKTSEENFKSALARVDETFRTLKSRGEADNSEAAVKIREVLDNTIHSIREVSDQAGNNINGLVNFNGLIEAAQKNYSQVQEQIKSFVGEARIRDLNSTIEDLQNSIVSIARGKTPTGDGQEKSASEKPDAPKDA